MKDFYFQLVGFLTLSAHLISAVAFILVVPFIVLSYDYWYFVIFSSVIIVIPMHALCFSTIYHKLLSHRSFKTYNWVVYTCVTVGVIFLRLPPPVYFVGMHRMHHKYSDLDKDPHSPVFGRRFVYFPWLFKRKNQPDINEEIWESANDVRTNYPYLNFITPAVLVWISIVYIALLYAISFDAFVYGSAIISLSMHLGSIGNTFLHKRLPDGSGESVNMTFGARWISPEFNHNQHHRFPGRYDFSTESASDWSVPFIKRFLIRNSK